MIIKVRMNSQGKIRTVIAHGPLSPYLIDKSEADLRNDIQYSGHTIAKTDRTGDIITFTVRRTSG